MERILQEDTWWLTEPEVWKASGKPGAWPGKLPSLCLCLLLCLSLSLPHILSPPPSHAREDMLCCL